MMKVSDLYDILIHFVGYFVEITTVYLNCSQTAERGQPQGHTEEEVSNRYLL